MPSAISPPTWEEELETNGFAVVKGAVPPERAAYYVEKMYEWLEKFPFGFEKDDKSTWTPEHLPVSMKGGMYHKYCVAHEKFVWEARMEPGVLSAFSKIWGTNELLSSFDGINFTFPQPPTTTPAPRWPHVDQNPHITGKQCIQGIINLNPNGPDDGGLMVMKGSKALFEEYFSTHSKEKNPKWGVVPDDWHGFDDEQVKWFEERGAKIIKVNADSGDLLLWDSRTVHWNVLPRGDVVRSVVYACYTPASFATKEDLAIKKDLFEHWHRTTHWPHRNFWRVTDETEGGTIYGRDEPWEKPELTEQLLKLAGAVPY